MSRVLPKFCITGDGLRRSLPDSLASGRQVQGDVESAGENLPGWACTGNWGEQLPNSPSGGSDDAEIKPMVNQVEFHPYLTQEELREYCSQHGIQVEAWRPLMKGEVANVPEIRELAAKYGKTPAQIVLRWNLQHGVVTIPKSVSESRIRENADLFDFELSQEDMAKLDGLNRNQRFGPDPDNFDF